ncbi:MAG: hypothetical protein WAL93_15510 [Desulfobacterales bacterium]
MGKIFESDLKTMIHEINTPLPLQYIRQDFQEPPRKDTGIFDRHTRGYVEDFCKAFMPKRSVRIE